jgi:plastocyanin
MDNEQTSGGASFVWPLIIIVILGLGAWLAYAWYAGEESSPAAVGQTAEEEAGSNTATQEEGAEGGAVVTYSTSGFSPATVTIQRGETVTWQSDGSAMWIGSNDHPTHTQYSGTSREEHCAAGDRDAFDQCAVGETYSFTFDKAGTWGYHNHRSTSHLGQVIVVE